MNNKPTSELDELLAGLKPDQVRDYLKENGKYLADEKKGFYYFMKDTLQDKGILLKDVYSFAGVSETFGSKILTMEKHTKNRDLILRFCVAGHFSVTETNRALKLYEMSPLYAKEKRDAILIVAINNRIFDLGSIDEMLEEQGFDRLSIIE